MLWKSTGTSDVKTSFETAVQQGLTLDGGLFVPDYFPHIHHENVQFSDYASLAATIISPFTNEDFSRQLPGITQRAFNFPIPLKKINDQLSILELFHGPTAAFKDVGARFLAETLTTISDHKKTILVATSGDTGGAVAAGFFSQPNTNVIILFPFGKVSKRQQLQLTTWGHNIRAFAVHGSFDDCQKMVKDALKQQVLVDRYGLMSANSINIGRLLPQMSYYWYASLTTFRASGRKATFIIPSGNVGNATAAYWAKTSGAPIEKIVIATNQNQVIPNFLSTGKWLPQPSVPTLANAMDVGNPSNMERLFHLFPDAIQISKEMTAYSVSDSEIEFTIKETYDSLGNVLCPHTACAEFVRKQFYASEPVIVVATAHPAKFETIVEPLIQAELEIPEQIKTILSRKEQFTEIAPGELSKLFT